MRLRRSGLLPRDAVPTRDISVLWAADMLRPSTYDAAAREGAAREGDETDGGGGPASQHDSWFYHQQRRLVENGRGFEQAHGYKLSPTNILYSSLLGGFLGAVCTFTPAGAAVGVSVGAVLGTTADGSKPSAATATFDRDASGVLTKAEVDAALKPWRAAYQHTEVRRRVPLLVHARPASAASGWYSGRPV
jgi:hypothetical protein